MDEVIGAFELEPVENGESMIIVSGANSGDEVPEDEGVKKDCEGTVLQVSVASSGISLRSSSSSTQTIVPPTGEPKPVPLMKSVILKL